MGIIRELAPSVVNQIAAGEVIERPASVVKELLENAIDAGASRIELSVERGGRDLVRVADDGRGIEREDLPLAFRPHATSKLASAEDLFAIRTLGFRGEALAAIAEISRVRCVTRARESDAGSEISIEGGQIGPMRDCPAAPGTVIEVRNLFFNTPVRRTFLKSDSTEASHVVEMFTRIALGYPGVHMTLRSGGRLIHDLPASSGLRERIAKFCGQELADSLIWVESRMGGVRLNGYAAHPSQSRSSAKGQYFFVGGRYVRDRSLTHALGEAYRGLLMVGRQAVAFLYLELPPEEVDVNVHPTKIEVRFRDANRVYSQMLSTLRQTFLASDLHARLQVPRETGEEEPAAATGEMAAVAPGKPDAGAMPLWPGVTDRQAGAMPLWPGVTDRQAVADWFAPAQRRAASPEPAGGRTARAAELPGFGPGAPARPAPEWSRHLPPAGGGRGETFDEFAPSEATRDAAEAEAGVGGQEGAHEEQSRADASQQGEDLAKLKAIQMHDSYLVAESSDGLVVIDQHALHERILYEDLRERVERGGVESQRLLVPEIVELSATDAVDLLERRELLGRLGIELESLGGSTVAVSSVPAMLGNTEPGRLVRDLADQFRGKALGPTADDLLEQVLSSLACKAAVKAGQALSKDEIGALLARRHLVANAHHCPHGRPAVLTLTRADLERQFGRT
jgi:DNA mismatch repair protein MutL